MEEGRGVEGYALRYVLCMDAYDDMEMCIYLGVFREEKRVGLEEVCRA